MVRLVTGRPAEDVWQYPRPPAIDPSEEHVVIELGGRVLADTRSAVRVLETSHPPTYYLPMDDVDTTMLREAQGTTWCEWKGAASYFDLVTDQRTVSAGAWTFPEPTPGFAAIAGHLAVYPGRVDRCTVDGEVVRAQEGDFYGGWITSRVRGPFKGAPGTGGW